MTSLTGSVVSGYELVCGDRDLEGDVQALFDQLAELWRVHHHEGFETRHRTGVLLNERLGPPTERKPYRERVLERASRECKVHVSDLSRMRWFAHLFKTLEDFERAHPQVNTWTGFKELLPDLKPREGDDVEDQPKSPSSSALGGVTRSLNGLIEKLRGMDSIPEGPRGEALREKLQVLIEVAAERLGVHAPSPALETDSSPGDPARANPGDGSSG
jgi:hypothetical protein